MELNDENLLAKIAKSDESMWVRIAAIKNITDQKTLSEIAKNDSVDDVRMAAIHKITDNELLRELLENEVKMPVKEQIIYQISDEDMLMDIRKNTEINYIYAATLKNKYGKPKSVSQVGGSDDVDYLIYVLNLLSVDSDIKMEAKNRLVNLGYSVDGEVTSRPSDRMYSRVMIDENEKRVHLGEWRRRW